MHANAGAISNETFLRSRRRCRIIHSAVRKSVHYQPTADHEIADEQAVGKARHDRIPGEHRDREADQMKGDRGEAEDRRDRAWYKPISKEKAIKNREPDVDH